MDSASSLSSMVTKAVPKSAVRGQSSRLKPSGVLLLSISSPLEPPSERVLSMGASWPLESLVKYCQGSSLAKPAEEQMVAVYHQLNFAFLIESIC